MTENVTVKLTRMNAAIQSRMLAYLRESAEKIADLAKLNAPVREYSVEESIESQEKRDGFRGSITIEVGINETKLAEKREAKGRNLNFRYDQWLHEAEYELGEESEMKDQTVRAINPKARVGNKFVERAYLSLRREIEQGARLEAAKTLRGIQREP